jgi:hypothetical protein
LNVLKSHLRITIRTLLGNGAGQRDIERITGVDRKTIRRYERAMLAAAAISPGVATGSDGRESTVLGEQIPPPWPPARAPRLARSACEAHRTWIEEQVHLGRNAQAVYQDLVGGSASRTVTTPSSASYARYGRGIRSASTFWRVLPARKHRSTSVSVRRRCIGAARTAGRTCS